MHSHHRGRGKVLFEVLCASGLAASLAGAWDQTGSSALLASASIMALFAVYWSFGLVARDRRDEAAQPTAIVADVREAAAETAVREEVLACEPEVLTEPEPVVAEPKKRRARKVQKAAAVVAPPEPVAIEQPVSNGLPLEQLFDVQPLVRQPRPAFGRKARGNRPLPAA